MILSIFDDLLRLMFIGYNNLKKTKKYIFQTNIIINVVVQVEIWIW